MNTVFLAIIAFAILFIFAYSGFCFGVIRGGKELLDYLEVALNKSGLTLKQKLEVYKALKEGIRYKRTGEEKPAPPTFEQSQGEQE